MGILDTSRFWMVQKMSVCKWFRFQMGSEIWKLHHLKSRKKSPFSQKPFEIWTKTPIFSMFWFSNGWDPSYSWSFSLTIWKLEDLKTRTWNPIFKKSGLECFLTLKCWMSDPHYICFWMWSWFYWLSQIFYYPTWRKKIYIGDLNTRLAVVLKYIQAVLWPIGLVFK